MFYRALFYTQQTGLKLSGLAVPLNIALDPDQDIYSQPIATCMYISWIGPFTCNQISLISNLDPRAKCKWGLEHQYVIEHWQIDILFF